MKYSPYSFSKIQTFFSCQKKFEYIYVNKIPIDNNYSDPSYFKRGRFIHAYIADRLNGGTGMKLSRYDVPLEDKLKLIECGNTALENELIQLTFDFETTEVEYPIFLDMDLNLASTKKESAINGSCDYFAVCNDYALIVDWKSGKYRENPNFSQLELYAVWVLQKHPQITEIDLMFNYVEHNKFELKTVLKNDLDNLKTNVSSKIKIIERTEIFEKNEGKHCEDCPFLNSCVKL